MTDLLWADKPAGLTTHTSLNEADRRKTWVDPHDGFMEWLSTRVGSTLFPVHRLDRETTGVMAFAKSKEAADQARLLFESRKVKKEYLFVTDRTAEPKAFTAESFIERIGNSYVSTQTAEPNSRTEFEFQKSEGRFSLWIARPVTGKAHQIRLHAQDHGLPLLGDRAHAGTEFPCLCLHAHQLTIEGLTHTSPPPIFFDDLTLLNDRRLVRWLAACDRRERALRSVDSPAITTTLRWVHTEGDPLRIEQLGDVISLNWFRDTYPNEDEWSSLQTLMRLKSWSTWYLQIRADRGKDPISDRSLTSEPAPPERWTAFENNLRFEFRRETGLSPGLFLDQRHNRAWVRDDSRNKRVLNLFCYTGGFSVAAAAGGAAQVVSVDVSKPFLEWAKENFRLNGLELTPHEFRAIDSGEYLAWAIKKGLTFDLVICDPPSFARTNTRGKKTVFRIETEFESLLTKCLQVTNAGGKILFSTNFEQWSLDELAGEAQHVLAALKKPNAKILAPPAPDLDFECPRQPRHMKSIVIQL